MEINQNFDAGNISVIDCNDASNIQLEINRDNNSEFFQWFYFRLSGVKNQQCTLNITNAKSAAYPLGFENYRVLYSYDRKEWCRHDTDLKADVLSIVFTSRHDSVYFAYFIPYSMERHHDLIANASTIETEPVLMLFVSAPLRTTPAS